MRMQRLLSVVALAAAVLSGSSRQLMAQGLTTGAISGTVTDGTRPLENAQVEVRNTSTGFRTGALTRTNGRYFVQGLTVGGPYTVTVRLLGFAPVSRSEITVALGQTSTVDITMQQAAAQLSAVEVVATGAAEFAPTKQGVGTVVSDSLLRRSALLQRDYTDLVKLTPQVTRPQNGEGPSAGGVYNRFNNYTVDGVNQNDRFNLGGSSGTPGGATGGRIMSIEAVKELQILLSPTDVRYGNFAGMLVNAVTKTGTNRLTGGATYGFRTPEMAADQPFIRAADFSVRQYGFSLGGPIIKDKLHFFVAPEWQQRTDPASGPSENLATGRLDDVSLDSIALIRSIMAAKGVDVGSSGFVSRNNPLANLMGRIDWQINSANRLGIRQLYNTAESDAFSRTQTSNITQLLQNPNTTLSGLRLTSNAFSVENTNSSTAVQLFTNTQRGWSNELSFGYNTIQDKRITPTTSPEVTVGVTPIGGTSPLRAVVFGAERNSPGNLLKQRVLEISENLSIPLGDHTVTLGGRYERTYIYNFFQTGLGGAYVFPTIASLQANQPTGYLFAFANGGDIAGEFNGTTTTGYAQDLWNVTQNLAVTAGIRVDVPRYLDTPGLNQDLLTRSTAAGMKNPIRTDVAPKTQALWSPRVGFNWNVGGNSVTQVRGNVGVFTSPVPFIFVSNAFSNTGIGGVSLPCSNAATPAYVTDPALLPKSCLGQPAPSPGAFGTSVVNVTDPNFKNPQNFTASFGVDRRLPGGVTFTGEAMYRRAINGLFVQDINLKGPRQIGGADYTSARGRTLYADTITVSGTGTYNINNNSQRYVLQTAANTNFSDGAIYLTNQSADYSYSLTGQLRKRFSRAIELTGAYTYMQAKDVQSLTSDRAISNYRNGRQPIGRIEDKTTTGTSYFERPNRLTLYGTYTAPWTTAQTDVSFFYEGISGSPITYVVSQDINGDGVTNNDPIYVPRSATDVSEIRIGTGSGTAFATNAAAAADFERFINEQPCLSRQRGSIMERNSCTTPWQTRFDLSVRQSIPRIAGQALTLQLDVFNFANLINRNWGTVKLPPIGPNFPQQAIFTVRQRTAAPLTDENALGYEFDTRFRSTTANPTPQPFGRIAGQSRDFYQLQMSLRYAF
ncbi:MAG: carboxypeptidase regulatory-like domain-containing protein [Gemmatimonadota bacterium]